MTPRLYCPGPLQAGLRLPLPASAVRHVQVLRLQPGSELTVFDGSGGEHRATVLAIGRSSVEVELGEHRAIEREPPRLVRLAIGIPANERMDWLVEKAAELGVAGVQPLVTQRTVVRLPPERARRRQAHWQAIVHGACEQCGRNRIPPIEPLVAFEQWLPPVGQGVDQDPPLRLLLSPTARTGLSAVAANARAVDLLSGPEGGLTPAEEEAARGAGYVPVSLGPRVLRADTAPLAALAALTIPMERS